MNDLAAHIQHTRLIDTHEHLHGEQRYVEQGPDLLQDLFNTEVGVAVEDIDDLRHAIAAGQKASLHLKRMITPRWQRC